MVPICYSGKSRFFSNFYSVRNTVGGLADTKKFLEKAALQFDTAL